MIDTSKIIYSINIEDVQNVAEEELGRKLTKKELKIIEDHMFTKTLKPNHRTNLLKSCVA